MRLLTLDSQGGINLTDDLIEDIPDYAILSHTWGKDTDEVKLSDIRDGLGQEKDGYAKVDFCRRLAQQHNLQHFWIDTCCIDKTNSSEVSEAVNSMFRWYKNSVRCYVYLSDVSCIRDDSTLQDSWAWKADFRRSRWFKRGWTLQELLAPDHVEFYSREGSLLGSKKLLAKQIHEITGIPIEAVQCAPLQQFSSSEKLRWASGRTTKRKEDEAYSLLGILGIFMPLIYGEGENALIRLHEHISKHSVALESTTDSTFSNSAIANDTFALRTNTDYIGMTRTHADIDEATTARSRGLCEQRLLQKAQMSIARSATGTESKSHFGTRGRCTGCRLVERTTSIRIGNCSFLLRYTKRQGQGCPIHQDLSSFRTSMKFQRKLWGFPVVVEATSILAVISGIPSISVLLKPEVRCNVLPLSSFFGKLYSIQLRPKSRLVESDGSVTISRRTVSREKQMHLLSVAQKHILQAYQAGTASLQDVDRRGRNLLHKQIELALDDTQFFLAEMIRFLLSLGFNSASEDDDFENVQTMLVSRFCRNVHSTGLQADHQLNHHVLEWTSCDMSNCSQVATMLDCIRRWPESSFDWGYPQICDIVIRRSLEDLELYLQKRQYMVETDARQLSPLHFAAEECWPEGTELLLAYGMDKYARNAKGDCALDIAIREQCALVAEHLLKGDCSPYLLRKRERQTSTLPPNFLAYGLHNNGALQDVIVKALMRNRHWFTTARPYHDLSQNYTDCQSIARKLLAIGFDQIDGDDENGLTPLMCACLYGNTSMIDFLLENGADATKSHLTTSLKAGHFYFSHGGAVWQYVWRQDILPNALQRERKDALLLPAYETAHLVKSRCRCSPDGFTPTTSNFISGSSEGYAMKRSAFANLILGLGSDSFNLGNQILAFARMELFNRLEMTHTCLRMFPNVRAFPDNDRVEIEEEEEEIYVQLNTYLAHFEKWQNTNSTDLIGSMDAFFDDLDLCLRPRECFMFLPFFDFDTDLLGRGTTCTDYWMSSKGKVQYSHREAVGDDRMLRLLYD